VIDGCRDCVSPIAEGGLEQRVIGDIDGSARCRANATGVAAGCRGQVRAECRRWNDRGGIGEYDGRIDCRVRRIQS